MNIGRTVSGSVFVPTLARQTCLHGHVPRLGGAARDCQKPLCAPRYDGRLGTVIPARIWHAHRAAAAAWLGGAELTWGAFNEPAAVMLSGAVIIDPSDFLGAVRCPPSFARLNRPCLYAPDGRTRDEARITQHHRSTELGWTSVTTVLARAVTALPPPCSPTPSPLACRWFWGGRESIDDGPRWLSPSGSVTSKPVQHWHGTKESELRGMLVVMPLDPMHAPKPHQLGGMVGCNTAKGREHPKPRDNQVRRDLGRTSQAHVFSIRVPQDVDGPPVEVAWDDRKVRLLDW